MKELKTQDQKNAKVRRILSWWGRSEAKKHKHTIFFLSRYTTVYCGLSNLPLNLEKMEMHHHSIGLSELIDDFLVWYGKPIEEYTLDTFWHDIFEAEMWKLDDQVIEDWVGFHNRNAYIMAVNPKPHRRIHYTPKTKKAT